MSDCKDCTCEMKYINNLFNNNMKNTKNILCKKNNTNLKYFLSIEFIFYLTSISLFSFYNYNKNKNNVNKKIL
jgi:hypothetical protein